MANPTTEPVVLKRERTVQESPQATRTTSPSGRIGHFAVDHAMVLVMLLVFAFFFYRSSRFATADNLNTVLVAAAPFALIALGQSLVIFTGGIDLSVGSVIAVSAMASAKVAVANPDNIWLALPVAVLAGVLAGLLNGMVIAWLHVPPFIATLGMLTGASGLAYVIGDGAPINGLPSGFGSFANNEILGLQIPVALMILFVIATGIIMRWTTFGMRIYALGGNRQAAEIAGVKVRRALVAVYTISGALAGLSGLMLASRVISGAPNLGQGYELDAIAAVVIGGASLMGGRGTIAGTALGLLLIQTLNNGLDLLVVPSYWQDLIKGVLIVSAVGVDVWTSQFRRR